LALRRTLGLACARATGCFWCFAGNAGRAVGHWLLGSAGRADFFFLLARVGLLGLRATGHAIPTAVALMGLKVTTEGGRWCGAGGGPLIFFRQLGRPCTRQFISLLLA